eukprot:m.50689 g.50689  ORF g.50689 m.50689 type:complete len:250 (-) comp21330_c0_seq3:369-1118(-)
MEHVPRATRPLTSPTRMNAFSNEYMLIDYDSQGGKKTTSAVEWTAIRVAWVSQCAAIQRKSFPKMETQSLQLEVERRNMSLVIAVERVPHLINKQKHHIPASQQQDNKPTVEFMNQETLVESTSLHVPKSKRAPKDSQQSQQPRKSQHHSSPPVVGFILISRMGLSACITKLCVANDHRSRGIGGALLDHALQTLKVARCMMVSLHVDIDRTVARTLYQKRGFVDAGGKLLDYYADGRHAYKMELDFLS